MKLEYDFEQLCDIIEKLRSENGCPWDREQTHDSLKNCMIEEAYEVVDGINQFTKNGDYDNLREELGDVLLQVVMHSQIAKEEGLFTVEEVIDEIAKKMVRRHPHVFGDVQVEDSAGVLTNWEEIKKEEKKGKTVESSPLYVPSSFPALLRAQKIVKKSNKIKNMVYTKEELFSKMNSETTTLQALYQEGASIERQKEAYGALLYTMSRLGLDLNMDAESCLTEKIKEEISKMESKIS
ncbi:MazG family protein [Lachnoclostridium sp.]|uniref:MazG family protein n=1 Tax=Lachnoclostridium sp. TaxID=2028282 RepID=UPI00267D213C|nr:MazG family protein [Lachnoclostridium sp.]